MRAIVSEELGGQKSKGSIGPSANDSPPSDMQRRTDHPFDCAFERTHNVFDPRKTQNWDENPSGIWLKYRDDFPHFRYRC